MKKLSIIFFLLFIILIPKIASADDKERKIFIENAGVKEIMPEICKFLNYKNIFGFCSLTDGMFVVLRFHKTDTIPKINYVSVYAFSVRKKGENWELDKMHYAGTEFGGERKEYPKVLNISNIECREEYNTDLKWEMCWDEWETLFKELTAYSKNVFFSKDYNAFWMLLYDRVMDRIGFWIKWGMHREDYVKKSITIESENPKKERGR